jgi:DNA-directed RNA polymerase specialized sigma24 family protein
MLRQHADTAPFNAIHAAQARARSLSRSLGAQSADAEDFRQAMLLDLIRRSGRFDAERGSWPAFVCVVTQHAATRIAKHRGRAAALITSLPSDHQLTDAHWPSISNARSNACRRTCSAANRIGRSLT